MPIKKNLVNFICLIVFVVTSASVLSGGKKLCETSPSSANIQRVQFEKGYYLELSKNKVYDQSHPDRESGKVYKNGTYLYFCSFTGIYKCNKDGKSIVKIYSRPASGVDMHITSIDQKWIYFEVVSEDGISVNKVKKDGSSYTHMKQKTNN